MPDAHEFLQDLAIVLCTAAVTTVLFQRLRQSSVVGYLLAGFLVGPYVPIFTTVHDLGTIRTLAELGVILLMFSLGLEFSLRRLGRLGPRVLLVAGLEIGLMLSLGFLAAQLLGWSRAVSLVTGGMVAISSTMILSRAFTERRPEEPVRELVFGVLVVEDLAAILIITGVTALLAGEAVTTVVVAREVFRLVGFLAVWLTLGLVVVPRALRAVIRLHRAETTVVASVGLSFATALAAQEAGFSVALGAFLGGSLVAESGAAHQVGELVRPIRDVFAAIFFVSVGMLIDPGALREHWGAILILAGVVVVGKVVGVSLGSFLAGYGTRRSVQAGMSLAQIGEFSFIIAGIGAGLGGAAESLYPIAVAVSVLTAFITPWMIRAAEPVALAVDRHLPRPLQTVATLYGSWIDLLRRSRPAAVSPMRRWVGLLALDAVILAAVIVGTAIQGPVAAAMFVGLTGAGAGAARLAVLMGAAVLALPFCIGIVGLGRRIGIELAGRALPPPVPGAVDPGLAPRRVLALTLQAAVLLAVGLPLVAITQPFLPPLRGPVVLLVALAVLALAFWRSAANLQGHLRAGAEVVVGALMPSRPSRDSGSGELQQLVRLLPGLGEFTPLQLRTGSQAVGRTLGELNLRGRTGATVVALVRGDESLVLPSAREQLQAGDLLALSGSNEAVTAALVLLRASGADRPVEAV